MTVFLPVHSVSLSNRSVSIGWSGSHQLLQTSENGAILLFYFERALGLLKSFGAQAVRETGLLVRCNSC